MSPELVHDLDVHDAIHVLFGCPTTLTGEVVAHVWTAFGTTARPADLHRVTAHRDHREVLAEIGHWRLLRTWIRGLPRIATAVAGSLAMRRRWPVEAWESFLDRPLDEIRGEFDIRLDPLLSLPRRTARRAGAMLRQLARHRAA